MCCSPTSRAKAQERRSGTLTDRLRDRDPELRPRSAAEALAQLERTTPIGPPGEPTQRYEITDARGPFEPSLTASRAAPRGRWIRALVIVAAAALAAIVAIAVLDVGDESGDRVGAQNNRASAAAKRRDNNGDAGASAGSASADQATAPATTTADTTTADATGSAPTATADGSALNDQGFALVNEGSYDEAVPVLQKAVDLLRDSGDEQTYNYALYNLGTALVGAGRYDEAIPVLQERMQYDDGQLDTVQAKLDEALAGAGQAPTGGTSEPKPPKEPKPGNPAPPGQTGAVPPGHQDEGD